MLNPSAVGHDVYDFMEGNVSDFYNAVDDAIVKYTIWFVENMLCEHVAGICCGGDKC